MLLETVIKRHSFVGACQPRLTISLLCLKAADHSSSDLGAFLTQPAGTRTHAPLKELEIKRQKLLELPVNNPISEPDGLPMTWQISLFDYADFPLPRRHFSGGKPFDPSGRS